MADQPLTCEPEQMDSEDMLFMLYTSGTTGKPKGIVHTTGGYMTGTYATSKWIFDLKEDDVYWCTADIGWVTGHSYIIYGPLANGATTVMYEGSPDYPDRDRFWAIVEKYACTICYTAPTAIRTFMRWGEEYPNRHDMSSLRLLGSVGEPINPEAWVWYWQHIGGGRCPVVDTWWQTETGAVMISALPGITTLKPGSATQPFPGIDAAILDEQGNEIGPGGGGYLVVRKPWPSMLRGIYGDPERFVQQYWSNYEGTYFTSDGAKLDEESYFWLLGRVDDVINVSAHRISTMEVESALVDNLKVAEAACIGRSHEVKGQAIVAFVTLKDQVAGSDDVITELKQHVAGKIGPMARPTTSTSPPSFPRPAAARSCAASSATWPRAAPWATPPPWPTRRWWKCSRSSTATRTKQLTPPHHDKAPRLDSKGLYCSVISRDGSLMSGENLGHIAGEPRQHRLASQHIADAETTRCAIVGMGDYLLRGNVRYQGQPHAGVQPHPRPGFRRRRRVAGRNYFHHQIGNKPENVTPLR